MKKLIPAIMLCGIGLLTPTKTMPAQTANKQKPTQTTLPIKASKSLTNTYVPQKDAYVKESKEDLAFIKIMQQKPEDCKKLWNQYISAKKVSKNYWQAAADSLTRAGKLVR